MKVSELSKAIQLLSYTIKTFDKACTTIHSYSKPGHYNMQQYRQIPMKGRILAKKWFTAKDNLGTPIEWIADQDRHMVIHHVQGHKVPQTLKVMSRSKMVRLGKIVNVK